MCIAKWSKYARFFSISIFDLPTDGILYTPLVQRKPRVTWLRGTTLTYNSSGRSASRACSHMEHFFGEKDCLLLTPFLFPSSFVFFSSNKCSNYQMTADEKMATDEKTNMPGKVAEKAHVKQSIWSRMRVARLDHPMLKRTTSVDTVAASQDADVDRECKMCGNGKMATIIFGCGHTSCSDCSAKRHACPVKGCGRLILTRTKMEHLAIRHDHNGLAYHCFRAAEKSMKVHKCKSSNCCGTGWFPADKSYATAATAPVNKADSNGGAAVSESFFQLLFLAGLVALA